MNCIQAGPTPPSNLGPRSHEEGIEVEISQEWYKIMVSLMFPEEREKYGIVELPLLYISIFML